METELEKIEEKEKQYKSQKTPDSTVNVVTSSYSSRTPFSRTKEKHGQSRTPYIAMMLGPGNKVITKDGTSKCGQRKFLDTSPLSALCNSNELARLLRRTGENIWPTGSITVQVVSAEGFLVPLDMLKIKAIFPNSTRSNFPAAVIMTSEMPEYKGKRNGKVTIFLDGKVNILGLKTTEDKDHFIDVFSKHYLPRIIDTSGDGAGSTYRGVVLQGLYDDIEKQRF